MNLESPPLVSQPAELPKPKPLGIRQQIARANSEQQVQDLLNRLKKFRWASLKTIRKCQAAATTRLKFLQTQKQNKNRR